METIDVINPRVLMMTLGQKRKLVENLSELRAQYEMCLVETLGGLPMAIHSELLCTAAQLAALKRRSANDSLSADDIGEDIHEFVEMLLTHYLRDPNEPVAKKFMRAAIAVDDAESAALQLAGKQSHSSVRSLKQSVNKFTGLI